jgi:hypothetical protein
MRKAQIRNGRVVNVIEVDPANVPDWCEDWPDAGNAGPGWIVGVDGSLQPEPIGITIEEATAQINAMIDAAAVEITGPVPQVERLSWTAKEQAARVYREGRGADYMLETEARLTGETVDGLAQKILANADRYRAAVVTMTGIRRAALSDMAADLQPADIVLERVQAELAALLNPV